MKASEHLPEKEHITIAKDGDLSQLKHAKGKVTESKPGKKENQDRMVTHKLGKRILRR